MSKLMIRIHNVTTNEVIDREMNDAELAEFNARNKALESEETSKEANTIAKIVLLKKLGITAEEASLLLS